MRKTRRNEASVLEAEFAGAELGDERRRRRLIQVVAAAGRQPECSLPRQAGSNSALEGTYRFLNNSEVAPEVILEPHVRCTVQRAAQAAEIIVAHDTTSFSFAGEAQREGLGRLRKNGQGFFAHYAVAWSMQREPLGTLGLQVWRRQGRAKGKRSVRQLQADEDRESLRWHDGVHAVAAQLGQRATAIHVMDREADAYELMADLVEHEQRFVIRVAHDRRLDGATADQGGTLYTAASAGEMFLERDVELSRRRRALTPQQRRIHPTRAGRPARLAIRACTVSLRRSKHVPVHLPRSLQLNVVEVKEVNAPQGETPVLWRLVTTEPIDTAQDVARIVDAYCQRWAIEEFFKAIKTGCAYQKLQLESGSALLRMLAIYTAVAWRLLLLRYLERADDTAPPTVVLTQTQLAVLKAVRAREGRPLSSRPSVHEVLLAIAALGGHIRNNGPPGWRVLGRGFDTLLLLELGWLAASDTTISQGSIPDVIND